MTTQAATIEASDAELPAVETPAPRTMSAFTLFTPSAPEILETARIIVPREDLNDEAFDAVRRGDAQKLKTLLESGLNPAATDAAGISLLDRAVERFTGLKHAVEQGETEGSQAELLKKLDPDSRADAGLAALVLASANGNVDVAQMVLNEMEDDALSDDDDDLAETIALEHGNMSVFLAIMARRQRSDFNKAAHDVHETERQPAIECSTAPRQTFGEWFHNSYEAVADEVVKDAKAVKVAFGKAAAFTGHITMEVCHAAFAFCSNFFHHEAQSGSPRAPEAAEAEKELKQLGQGVSLLARLFGPDNSNRP